MSFMNPAGRRSSTKRTTVARSVPSVNSNTPAGRGARGDQELQPPRGIEDGYPVVAVDAAAAWAGEDLPVGRTLAGGGVSAGDVEDTGAPFAVMGAVREIVEDLARWPVDGDGVFGVWHLLASPSCGLPVSGADRETRPGVGEVAALDVVAHQLKRPLVVVECSQGVAKPAVQVGPDRPDAV